MSDENLVPMGSKSFEDLKKANEHGAEYWSARDIQPLLGYTQWRRFEDAVKRALTSCKQSGNDPSYHFAGAGKPIEGGKGAVQTVNDYQLSRFACYLIAQNGDPRKSEIANAQEYFAIQASPPLTFASGLAILPFPILFVIPLHTSIVLSQLRHNY